MIAAPLVKTALITGASKRIGMAIALGLANAGYAVAVHYNASRADAEEVVAQIEAAGGQAIAVQADLTDEQSTRTLIERTGSQLGRIGVLINNASLFVEDEIGSDNSELWNQHFSVHVRAPGILAAEFCDQLADDKHGLIVNIIDQRVWKLNPNFHSYTLSKSALWTATQTMAQTFAPRIRVNAIGPGPTLPSFRQTQEQFDQQVETLPLRVAPQLDEFTKTILFFADTPSVTGQMIALDGGQHLAWETDDLKVRE